VSHFMHHKIPQRYIIFDLSNGSIISSLELPFILPEGAGPDQLELAPPFNFGAPIIIEQPHGGEATITLNKAAFYPTVADRENNTRYLLDVVELQQLIEEATQQGLFEPLNLSANYTMNGTETIVSSGIILDVSDFQALEVEGGEVKFQPIPYPILDSLRSHLKNLALMNTSVHFILECGE